MSTQVLSQSKYIKLSKDIKKIIYEGKTAAAQTTGQELLKTYWNVGKRLAREHLSTNAGYSDSILLDLSQEISIDDSTLKRSIQFFNTYSGATRGANINWSHIKRLLPIKDLKERQWYEDLISNEKINVLDLGFAINSDRYNRERKLKTVKIKQRTKRPTTPTYLYKAYVKRVIDGDTLLLNIDLGFQVFKEQRVRLTQIDAPPLSENSGKESSQFVLNQLARVEFVMVKTNKIDIYGRYLGDIFYSFEETNKDKIFTKGKYLNEELVRNGFAKVL